MKKKYILIGILAKVAYDKFMAQTEFGKKWKYFWNLSSTKTVFEALFNRKLTFSDFKETWESGAR